MAQYTHEKENEIFVISRKIQSGSGAKLYMRKGFLIYEEIRKYLTIYKEAVSHIWLCTRSLWISLYMRKILCYFLSVYHTRGARENRSYTWWPGKNANGPSVRFQSHGFSWFLYHKASLGWRLWDCHKNSKLFRFRHDFEVFSREIFEFVHAEPALKSF